MRMKSVQKEAQLAYRLSKELHAIPPDEMTWTEKQVQTIPDMIQWFAQMEDEKRHQGINTLTLPRHYPIHDYFPKAPLHAFLTQILP